jgi:hypothetical protein
MLDIFKKVVSPASTAGKASGDNRAEYMQYVDDVTSRGQQPMTYEAWLKQKGSKK